MSKHTPGPWEVSDHVDNEYGNTDFCQYQIRGPAGTGGLDLQIATVISDCIESHEENARLIAAAPDLLEALMNASGVLQAYATQSKTAEICEQMARAAIAKATGEKV